MKRTGERLKASREEQKLTISEVSLSTKINPRVLQAMEEGNLDKLPAVSFLRGFIRTYAIYLKLDANELLELFSKELAELRPAPVVVAESAHPSAPPANTPPGPESSTKARPAPPTLREPSAASRSMVAGGVILLIVIILGVKQIVEKYEREGNVDAPPENLERLVHDNDPASPEAAVAPNEKSAGDDKAANTNAPEAKTAVPAPTGESAPAETVTPPPAATATPPPTATPPTAAPTPTNTVSAPPGPTAKPLESPKPTEPPKQLEPPKPVEPPKPAEVAKPTPPPPTPPPAAVKPPEVAAPPTDTKPTESATTTDTPKPPKTGSPQEVIIEALDQVEVSFRIDGGRLETIVLKPEQIHTLKGATSLAVDFSDGGAVNVIHNGIDKGVPGDLGKPKKIKFP